MLLMAFPAIHTPASCHRRCQRGCKVRCWHFPDMCGLRRDAGSPPKAQVPKAPKARCASSLIVAVLAMS